MKTQRLNDTIIKTLPEGEYRDSQYHFLYIRIGKKKSSWYFLRTINKKTRRVKIGIFPDVNSIDARDLALKVASSNSQEVKRSLTLYEAYEFYINNRKPKNIKKIESFFKKLEVFHSKRISAIKKEDIQQFYTGIVSKTGVTGNRVLSLLKAIISYAIQHGKLENDINGLTTIKKTYKEHPRENFLPLADAKKLNTYLNEKIQEELKTKLNYIHNRIYIIIKTLLFTGARKQNVLQMEKKELDFEDGTWTIPIKKSKTDKEIVCHLVPDIITCLQKLIQESENNDYVFINPKTGRPFTEIRKTWNRIQKKLDISATIHDLRRTCASLHVNHGASIKQIADTLGDASLDMVARVYAKTESSIQRENANKLSKLISD
jgi:integrase